MLIQIKFTFAMFETVEIIALETKGFVVSILIEDSQETPKYKVRFFQNGEVKEIYFYDWELEKHV